MHVRHDLATTTDEQAATGARAQHADRVDGNDALTAAPVLHATDPRLAHAGAATTGLMALQRSAGNAAVASLVAPLATVQRMPVEINEMTSSVRVSDAPPAPAAGAGSSGGAGGPVTSDGSTTTITGGTITLAAPMTTAEGVIRADTIIADSVVASNYTPGAGNVW